MEKTFNTSFTEKELEFLDKHTISLQGKHYTQVNARVEVFRKRNPYGQILTDVTADGKLVKCVIKVDGTILATAHKSIGKFVKGGVDMGTEKAETGAIGRALAMCGIGTMTGELDEDEQIAEAPVDKHSKKVKAADIAAAVSKR